jgi:hypothetical protein
MRRKCLDFGYVVQLGVFIALLSGCRLIDSELDSPPDPPSWRSITPGRSSADVVVDILGPPDIDRQEAEERVLEYRIPGRDIDQYNHRIFLRSDVVAWIDVAVLAGPDDYYLIDAALEQYGRTVDRIVRTRPVRDVLSNEHVYIWAQEGVALIAVPAWELDLDLPAEMSTRCREAPTPEERHPDASVEQYPPELRPSASPCHVVVRMILFTPVAFDEFCARYLPRIPHLWPFYDGYREPPIAVPPPQS